MSETHGARLHPSSATAFTVSVSGLICLLGVAGCAAISPPRYHAQHRHPPLDLVHIEQTSRGHTIHLKQPQPASVKTSAQAQTEMLVKVRRARCRDSEVYRVSVGKPASVNSRTPIQVSIAWVYGHDHGPWSPTYAVDWRPPPVGSDPSTTQPKRSRP